jgi:hypothetical protein
MKLNPRGIDSEDVNWIEARAIYHIVCAFCFCADGNV